MGAIWIAGDYQLQVTAKVRVGFLIQKATGTLAFSISAP